MRAFTTMRRIAFAALLSVTAILAQAAPRWGDLADTVFQHVALDTELPNSAVPTALAQDAEGYLWIGTQNGLARWDGYHFRVFHAHAGERGALPDNFIQTVHCDARGTLWVGTVSGGLARYDREHDRFITYPAGPVGLSHVSVRAIADDGGGGVWVATEGGLDHVLPDASRIEHVRHLDSDPASLPDDSVRGLYRDRRGSVWIGTAGGLVRMEADTRHLVRIELPAGAGKLPVAATFLEDSGGRMWIGTVRDGAYLIESPADAARPVQESDAARSNLRNEGISAILEPHPGTIWIGTVGQGLLTLDVATGRTRRLRHDPALATSLTDNNIEALYRDRAGLVWICSVRSMSTYDPSQRAFITVFGASSRQDSISETNVDAILPMPDGRIWLGLDSNGVDVIDPDGVRVAALRADPAHPANALPKGYVNAFAASGSGDVFVGTEQGLYRADAGARAAVRVAIAGRDPSAPVWALLRDERVLWIGGDGLWTLDLAGGGPAAAHVEAAQALTDQRITSFARDRSAALWVGTKNGLNRIDLHTHALERILPDPADPGALSAAYVTSLLTDSHGRLWVSTFGGGVDVLTTRDPRGRPRFRHIGLAQGLVNENTDMLLEDPQHRVWVSTDEGLAVIDETSFAVRALRRAEGLPITNYWVGAGAMTPEGELLYGGVGGLTVVRPEKLTRWTFQPPLVVTDVRIGGKTVAAGAIGTGETLKPLVVQPHANSIAVEFSALDYSAPQRNRYVYRLEGFDSGWLDSEPGRRLAAYTNLPPGQYRLHLRGSNRDGVWSARSLILPIRVLPSWYQTMTFRIATVLAGLALVALLVQARTLYLRRNQRDLERQVIERTAELRASQRQLEQIAYYDTLTALPNRRMFTEEFRELIALAHLQGVRFALLLIDLDRFKQINDSLGHDAGDALLIEAAIRLQASVRKSDCVARLGGDEFGVLVADNPAATDIERICERIIESFVLPVSIHGVSVKSSATIGVASFGDHGETLDSLYKSADLALYEAKRAGGNLRRWYHGHSAGTLALPVGRPL
ncbi:MAG TPA: diguanylate cyclase [Steroidobacteraceae bacterium]